MRLLCSLAAAAAIALSASACHRPGFGGCRIQDTVLVTDDGYEAVTAFPYGLGG